MDRVILHSDCNHFYASVECLHHPEIRDKSVAVDLFLIYIKLRKSECGYWSLHSDSYIKLVFLIIEG